MIIDFQFIIFLVIAYWFGYSELIFKFLGYDPENLSLLYYLLLWLVIIFVVSVVFIVIFRALKKFFKFLLNKLNKT